MKIVRSEILVYSQYSCIEAFRCKIQFGIGPGNSYLQNVTKKSLNGPLKTYQTPRTSLHRNFPWAMIVYVTGNYLTFLATISLNMHQGLGYTGKHIWTQFQYVYSTKGPFESMRNNNRMLFWPVFEDSYIAQAGQKYNIMLIILFVILIIIELYL